jgi:hypothetical protein
MGIDMASFSGHKIHSAKGSGVLFVKKNCRISPLILGGGQQRGIRSGTESVYLSGAFALALTLAEKSREDSCLRVTMLKEKLKEGISDLGAVVLSPDDALPYVVNISFRRLKRRRCFMRWKKRTYSFQRFLPVLRNRRRSVMCFSKWELTGIWLKMPCVSVFPGSYNGRDHQTVLSIHQVYSQYSVKRGKNGTKFGS